jgi:hypothetical protein
MKNMKPIKIVFIFNNIFIYTLFYITLANQNTLNKDYRLYLTVRDYKLELKKIFPKLFPGKYFLK